MNDVAAVVYEQEHQDRTCSLHHDMKCEALKQATETMPTTCCMNSTVCGNQITVFFCAFAVIASMSPPPEPDTL